MHLLSRLHIAAVALVADPAAANDLYVANEQPPFGVNRSPG